MSTIDKLNDLPFELTSIGHLVNPDDTSASFFCGREQEVRKIHIILHKIIKNNVLLVGRAGVGKTSLIYYYAHKYKNKNIFAVESAKLIADTQYRGSFEKKVTDILKIAHDLNLTLFFDEIHSLINLGNTKGGMSTIDILKPYLLNYSMRFIGATTEQESRLLLEDEAFKRRFSIISLSEPSHDILISIKNSFENNILNQRILDEKETETVINDLTQRLPGEVFPDKLIDFLDYLWAYISINGDVFNLDSVLEEYIDDKKS